MIKLRTNIVMILNEGMEVSFIIMILLMEEIPNNHLTCDWNHGKECDIYHINIIHWCKIFTINSSECEDIFQLLPSEFFGDLFVAFSGGKWPPFGWWKRSIGRSW